MAASSAGKEEYQYFDQTDMNDMIRMYTEDGGVRGAFNLRYNQLCIPQMVAESDGEPMGKLMNHVFTTYWTNFLHDMYDWFNVFDHCLYYLETETIPIVKDELRMEKYGRLVQNEKFIHIKVPIALPLDAEIEYAAMRRRKHRVDIVALTGEGVVDKSIKIVMKSQPVWHTRKHCSDVALLLREWRELNEEKRLKRQVDFSLACPPVFLQRNQPTDMQQLTDLNALHAEARTLERDQDGYFTKANPSVSSVKLEGKNTNETLHEKLFKNKTLIDRTDNFIPIPPQYEITNAVAAPTYNGDILKRIENFKESIGLVTMVPFYLIKPTYGSHAAGSKDRSTEQANLLKEHVQLLAQTLARAIKEVWCVVYPNEDASKLMIHLPVYSSTDLVSVFEMFERGVIGENLAREEALRTFHIDPRRIGEEKPSMKQAKRQRDMAGGHT